MKKTIENLAKAYVGESQARNRYTFYASTARNEGYEQIAEVFLLTADQEKSHAKNMLKHLKELGKNESDLTDLKIDAEVPTVLGTTIENLRATIIGESHEFTSMYPEFAATADREGFTQVAARFRAVTEAEKHHQERFSKILKGLEDGTTFKRSKDVWWVCRECGYQHFGKTPPEKCPSCDHPKAFYQFKSEEY